MKVGLFHSLYVEGFLAGECDAVLPSAQREFFDSIFHRKYFASKNNTSSLLSYSMQAGPTQCVMPTGSPSPPYKGSPEYGSEPQVLSTY